jgi:hypothetical protein
MSATARSGKRSRSLRYFSLGSLFLCCLDLHLPSLGVRCSIAAISFKLPSFRAGGGRCREDRRALP